MDFMRSKILLERALKCIPKGTQTASKCYDQWAFGSAPIFCNRGKGCYIYDVDGNKYIDHMSALGPIILGYNYRKTNIAIKKQLKKGIVFSLSSPLEVELAEIIKESVPCAEMIRFGKNGSDVTSIAVRVARAYTGKELLLSPEGHYHGWADFAAASSSRKKGVPECLYNLVHKFKYNDLEDLEAYLKKNKYAAVIMEPSSLEFPKKDYLSGVRMLCDKYNVLLIFDEMITGFRWALGGAQEYFGVTADIATYGKAIANGMPISIIAGKRKYMKELDEVFFSGTYLGETLSIAAAISTIKEIKSIGPKFYEHIWREGDRLRISFNNYAKLIGLPAYMFGCGPRHNIKFELTNNTAVKDLFHQEMIKRGIFMGTQIYVTWAHKKKHIDKTIIAMKNSLYLVKKAIEDDNVDRLLSGSPSCNIFKSDILKGNV